MTLYKTHYRSVEIADNFCEAYRNIYVTSEVANQTQCIISKQFIKWR